MEFLIRYRVLDKKSGVDLDIDLTLVESKHLLPDFLEVDGMVIRHNELPISKEGSKYKANILFSKTVFENYVLPYDVVRTYMVCNTIKRTVLRFNQEISPSIGKTIELDSAEITMVLTTNLFLRLVSDMDLELARSHFAKEPTEELETTATIVPKTETLNIKIKTDDICNFNCSVNDEAIQLHHKCYSTKHHISLPLCISRIKKCTRTKDLLELELMVDNPSSL